MCCPMKKNSLSGNERFEQENIYVDGNTIIRINEFFPDTGPTITELLENVVRYEGRMTLREQDNSSDG